MLKNEINTYESFFLPVKLKISASDFRMCFGSLTSKLFLWLFFKELVLKRIAASNGLSSEMKKACHIHCDRLFVYE